MERESDVEQIAHLASVLGAPHADSLMLEHVERHHVYAVIGACRGNLSLAAKALGLHRRTLQRNLKTWDRRPIRRPVIRKPKPLKARPHTIEAIVELAERAPRVALRRALSQRVFG